MKPEDLKAIEELLREIELTFCFSSSTSKAAIAIRALLQENARIREAADTLDFYVRQGEEDGIYDPETIPEIKEARTALGEK